MGSTKRTWLWIGFGFFLLCAAYAATRLVHLTTLPIFTDEAIYIRWSQIGMRDPNWRFISLVDGKQPMFTWVMMVLLKIGKHFDPLFIGRLTSVLSGFGTMLGVWFLSRELFRDRRVPWVASVLYLFIPFTLWYDRMALYDSMVSMFSVWSLFFAVLMAKRLRLDTALLLGLVLGAGMLNKTSAFLSLYFLPVTLLVFDWQKKDRLRRLGVWILLAVFATGLSQLLYGILRLSPFYHMIAEKDNVFVFSIREWLNEPFRFFAGNLRGMFDWLRSYLTFPIFVAVVWPLFARFRHDRERWLLYLWWALPFGALAAFAKILYPRFILFMSIPLLVVASESIIHLWDGLKLPILRIALVILLAAPSLYVSYFIVLHPVSAPIPVSDRSQYIDDWPAGGGVPQVIAFLTKQVAAQKIHVFTEGTFGLMPYSIEIYLVENPNITIKGVWPLPETMPLDMRTDAASAPTYFIMNQTQVAPPSWPLTLIGQYQKGDNTDQKLRLYRVNAPKPAKL